MKPFEVFKAGTHRDSRGVKRVFTAAMLTAMAVNFNADLSGAPLVVGHPQGDAPAYGWVEKFTVAGDRLIAHPNQVQVEFSDWVKNGRYPKRSIAFYGPDDPSNPAPGTYYPRHVGFLGGAAPAIKGLKNVEFSTEDNLIEFSDVSAAKQIGDTALIGAITTALRKIFGPADKSSPEFQEHAIPNASQGDPNPNPDEDIMTEKEKIEFEERVAAVKKREDEATARELEFAAANKAQRADADKAMIDALEADGKITPSDKAGVLEFMATLDGDDAAEIEFSQADGKTKVKQTPHKFFTGLISGANPQINFSEISKEDDEDADIDGDDAGEIAKKALEYQKSQSDLGVTINMSSAVQHVTKSKAA